jgi:hypothetical protein
MTLGVRQGLHFSWGRFAAQREQAPSPQCQCQASEGIIKSHFGIFALLAAVTITLHHVVFHVLRHQVSGICDGAAL